MNLQTILLVVGAIAVVLTLVVGLIVKGHKSWLMTFLQNFCGVFFLFSGWVKAVDPLGTAYKLEQYFSAFESTFEGTWFSFIVPIFPFFESMKVGLSVGTIVFEIVLGIMLLLGHRTKFLSWAFFLIILFFTFLTGFTYLTGYVPQGVNFFQFGQWAEFKETNMQVTDCGCFGDFLKLKPFVSFMKDIGLMFPAIYFLFKHRDMHQLFSKGVRDIIIGLSIVGLLVYCMSNYVWDLPHADFRPFKAGADIRTQKQAEMDAAGDVEILGWKFMNANTGEEVSLMNPDYMAIYKDYPKEEGWSVDQIKSAPSIEATKISDYEITDADGNDMTDELLSDPGASIMIVSHKMKSDGYESKTSTYMDTVILRYDTITSLARDPEIMTIDTIVEKSVTLTDYSWDGDFADKYRDVIKPFTDAAMQSGVKVYGVAGGAMKDQLVDFSDELGLGFEFYTADDILLKTIVRSNPGIVLWKNGRILAKWHEAKLPSFESVKDEYLK